MTKISAAILIILLFVGCNGKNGNENKQVNSALETFPIDSSIFGTWINITYLDNIEKLKSPYSVSKLTPYEFLKISKDYLKGDTVRVTWMNEELSEFPGFKCYRLNSSNKFEYLGYSYDDEKPDLKKYYYTPIPPMHFMIVEDEILYITDTKNNIIEQFKLITKTNNEHQLLYEKVNKIVIEGNYQDVDDPNHVISFLSNNKVVGLGEYEKYNVNLFFAQDYGVYENDFIELFTQGKSIASGDDDNKLIFEFEGDTLMLYEIYNDTTQKKSSFQPTKGKLQLKLKRQ